MKKQFRLLVLVGIFFSSGLFGQNDSTDTKYAASDTISGDFGLFTKDELLKISLRFNMTEYTRKRSKEDYLKAILTYHLNDKDSVNREIRLKSRGEFRNGFCDFPPIRLNFKNAGFKKDDLKEIEAIKLVTHCKYGNEENLLKEYLCYKLFNVLTDKSFRARLLEIDYINTYKNKKPVHSYGFLIEPISILAERINAVEVESLKLGQKSMSPETMNRLAIFNYMIGNTDWSVPNQHNCKILSPLKSETPGLGLIIPYDFDYSGLVNADYAVPSDKLSIKSVTERLYIGLCRSDEEILKALKEFVDKKESFYKVVNDFPYLSERTKKEITRYLDQFYSEIDKNNTILYNFKKNCVE